MPLFTDGPINTNAEFPRYESGILSVVSTEVIDLSAKAALAQDDVATDLLLFLNRSSSYDPKFLCRRKIGLSDVVVTAPLKRWHAYATLALVYRDAYNNQLNDRYLGKWNEYQKSAADAAALYLEAGVGVAHQPTPQASAPDIELVAAAVTATSYYVSVSWVNATGQEGCASSVILAASPSGSALEIRTSATPAGIIGWDLYLGSAPDNTCLQNNLPLAPAAAWIAPETASQNGRQPGTGQVPDFWIVDRHILPRG